MQKFQIIVLTLPGFPDPSLAIAASRAGGLGVLDLEYTHNKQDAVDGIRKLANYAGNDFGIKVNANAGDFLAEIIPDLPEHLKLVILTYADPQKLGQEVQALRDKGLTVMLESTCLEEARAGEQIGVNGVIAKGHEAGGRVGNETTFILLQRLLKSLSLPVWVQGGIGLHTASACYAAGAAGVILDMQLALTRESPLPETAKTKIAIMDGSETVCLGSDTGEIYQVCSRLGIPVVEELRRKEKTLTNNNALRTEVAAIWRQAVSQRVGWDSLESNLYLMGQDVAFAAPFAKRFVTVGGVLEAIRQAIDSNCQAAFRLRILSERSPLAQSHGTRYPIVQGPMARVSDTPAFAQQVAQGGALPFLALAWMRGQEVDALFQETRDKLKENPWGVGLLGFIPLDLYKEQLKIVSAHHPPFALIAGGRADQAKALEQEGISTYLHVPSPGLLRMFLESGVRRFVFEGWEAGGHVGPRCGFVLWETMINALLESIPMNDPPKEYHVLFAGGIHDALSASMVAAMAAPLAERGIRVGFQLGSAYLATQEAVSTDAIVKVYQQEAIRCDQTILLETGPGHVTRCADTPYAKAFQRKKQRLLEQGESPDKIRNVLEQMVMGRLRVASKGAIRHPEYGQDPQAPKFVTLNENEQRTKGIYMIGQLAALRDKVCTIDALHHDIVVEGAKRIEALYKKRHEVLSPEKDHQPSDIAIIGMACIFPKAPTLQTYWENILNRVSAITEVPKSRWDWNLYYNSDRQAKDKIYSKWGAFLDDVPFDPVSYGMPPNSLSSIEPLQLLTLQVVNSALEDAGYATRPFSRERTSVILGISGSGELGQMYSFRSTLPMFLGSSSQDILSHFDGVLPEWTEDSFSGILMNVAAGRVANRFDLGGVNYTVDAACASSLAAVYLGVGELENHSSNMVIVGAADCMQNPFTYQCFAKTQALSPRGRCHTLDESADGIVLGEGVAVVILKRLTDAQQDGDRIYAVIKGVGASSDGKDKSLTAPSPEGQEKAFQRAYAKAGFSPGTVGLIEAHGTGTVVGDRVEIEALSKIFKDTRPNTQSCAIGSVKSMIGHTKSSAGLAGLIKTALALHHKVLPPTLGVENPNPVLRLPDSPFYANTETRPWINHMPEYPRRAGVNALGFGGTNFHVVAEEYTQDFLSHLNQASFPTWPSELLIWKGNSRQALLEAIRSLEKRLSSGVKVSLKNLAFTLSKICEQSVSKTNDAGLSLAVVASSSEDLRQKLNWAGEALSNSDSTVHDPRGIYFSEQPLALEGKLAFLFPGQGSQYVNMLSDIVIQFPEIRALFEQSNFVLKDKLPVPLSSFIFPPSTFSKKERNSCEQALAQTQIAQSAVGTAELAMFHLLESLGVKPDMAAGHSYGEYVALYAAGVLNKDDLIALSEARGRFIVDAAGPEPGTMAAVNAGVQTVSEALKDMSKIWIANLNAPEQTIISGTQSAIKESVKRFKDSGIRARLIPVACAFHSPIVSGACERLRKFLSDIKLDVPYLEVYSNTTARPYPAEPKAIAEQLVRHLVSRVEFIREIEAMYEDGARIFVEVGPGRVLSGLIDRIIGDRSHLAVTSNQSGRSGLVQLHHCLGQLAAHGVPVKTDGLYEGRSSVQIDLKTLDKGSCEPALSPTTWLVNGARAKPLKEASASGSDQGITPVHIAIVREETAAFSTESEKEQVPTSTSRESRTVAQPSSFKPESNRQELKYSSAPSLSGDGVAQVVTRFQQMMNRFLETQKSVMLTYLQTTPDADRVPAEERRGIDRIQTRATTSPEQDFQAPLAREVHPRAIQERSMEEAPIRTSKTSKIEEKLEPLSSSKCPSEAKGDFSEEKLVSCLLKIVGERTGYPQDMLNLDHDLEADLGIDSIKRIEILGSFLQSMDSFGLQQIEKEMENLAGIKTLRGIIQWLMDRTRPETNHTDRATGREAEESPTLENSEQESAEDETVQRFTLSAVTTSYDGRSEPLPVNGVVVVTDDEKGVARSLVDKLKSRGQAVALVQPGSNTEKVEDGCYKAALHLPEEVARLLETIRQRQGHIGGLIHLLPLKIWISYDDMDFSMWKERLQLEVKSLFYLIKGMKKDLKRAQEKGRACIIAATNMGGSFASDPSSTNKQFFPGQGGIAGLLKTVAIEWPDVRVKAVDLNSEEPVSDLANHLLAEMSAEDHLVEVGYDGSQRVSLKPTIVSLDLQVPSILTIGSSWVLLITGGARGITADVACELARRYQPILILAGRSPLPVDEESPETAGLTGPQELKSALISKMRQEDESISLSQVEAAYTKLLKEREIRKNLEVMQSFGARVVYFQVDVRNEQAFGGLIDEIYNSYGRIDGVIHGAGVIEDKFIIDKTPDSFDRVFDTKVDSGFILSHKLRPDSLKFLVFFASVAGRFGNQGQGDYAAANEVLNKLAIHLDSHWPGRVVAINWGPWAKAGMVSAELLKQFAERGVQIISRSSGPRKLDEELRYGRKGEVEIVIGSVEGWKKTEENQSVSQIRILPLISSSGSFLRKSDGSLQLLRSLDPSRDLYLRDHQLDGKPVLPASVAIELMVETVAQGWPDLEVASLKDIRVLRGLTIGKGPETIQVLARPTVHRPQKRLGLDGLDVEVEITGLTNIDRPYYRATVKLSDSLPAPPAYELTLPSNQETFPTTIKEAYRRWLFHGPTLQCISEIKGITRQGIVATVIPSTPQQCMTGFPEGQWLIDPIVIDSGFQLAILWARIYHDFTPLPSYFPAYRRFGSLSGPLIRCYLQFRSDPSSLIMHTDLYFVNSDGYVMGFFEGAESTCSRALNRFTDIQMVNGGCQ